jgi:ABC-type multidrug transport system ATPase subunit
VTATPAHFSAPSEGQQTTVAGSSHASSRSTSASGAPLPVRAVKLGKAIESRHILREINLEIPQGQFIALLGANGAGKSTLLKILSTLTAPTSGTLELFGHPAASSAVKIRRQLGLIGHQTMLYHDLSALENLTFFAKLYGVPNPQQRGKDLLNQLGLGNRANDPVKNFSRGMAQRVAIARALLHEPQLLLADEPFAGLDAPSAAMLERLLTSLHAQGQTIILANHDIAQSLRLAQRAVVLAGGRKVVDAPSDSLQPAAVLAHMNPAQGAGGAAR